jgi:hypothetical protein
MIAAKSKKYTAFNLLCQTVSNKNSKRPENSRQQLGLASLHTPTGWNINDKRKASKT